MKKIISTLIFVTILTNIFAICDDRGLWFFPENKTIKQNSWFMIEGYATSQSIINSLNNKYPVYLQSGKHKVKLIVISTHKGAFGLTQAILKPAKKLKSGKTYQLKIDNLDDEQKNELLRQTGDQRETPAWIIEKRADTKVPKWAKTPQFKENQCIHFGCGPEVYAIFDIDVTDESEFLVKTEFKNIHTNTTTTYFLVSKNKQVKVGHGMCAGAFKYASDENHKFQVRFLITDASGNQQSKFSEPIKFKNPYSEFEEDENYENSTKPTVIEHTEKIQGRYSLTNGNEFWIFYFSKEEDVTIAQQFSQDGYSPQYTVEKISKNKAKSSYNIKMEGVSGEMVPTWNIQYNTDEKCYDLYFYDYNVEEDKWEMRTYNGTKKDKIYEKADEMPKFIGGKVALDKYLAENLNYPEIALENNIEGTVYLKFEVKADGSVGRIELTKKAEMLLDKRALEMVVNLPKFIPGKQNGKNIAVWYSLPIEFVIDF